MKRKKEMTEETTCRIITPFSAVIYVEEFLVQARCDLERQNMQHCEGITMDLGWKFEELMTNL